MKGANAKVFTSGDTLTPTWPKAMATSRVVATGPSTNVLAEQIAECQRQRDRGERGGGEEGVEKTDHRLFLLLRRRVIYWTLVAPRLRSHCSRKSRTLIRQRTGGPSRAYAISLDRYAFAFVEMSARKSEVRCHRTPNACRRASAPREWEVPGMTKRRPGDRRRRTILG